MIFESCTLPHFAVKQLVLKSWFISENYYYIDTDDIPGFFLLLKNHIFTVRSEDTIFIFHV